jgi:hypothetical protein
LVGWKLETRGEQLKEVCLHGLVLVVLIHEHLQATTRTSSHVLRLFFIMIVHQWSHPLKSKILHQVVSFGGVESITSSPKCVGVFHEIYRLQLETQLEATPLETQLALLETEWEEVEMDKELVEAQLGKEWGEEKWGTEFGKWLGGVQLELE